MLAEELSFEKRFEAGEKANTFQLKFILDWLYFFYSIREQPQRKAQPLDKS